MSLKLNLLDDEFPFTYVSHTRTVVRGIVLNDENKVAVCVVNRDDIFGKCNYIETPGGGKEDNESLEDGLVRELDEELGYKVEIIEKIGIIEDYYNLINRKNINHYYLCRIKEKTKVHHESSGDDLIKEIRWISIEEAIDEYENMSDSGLIKLVKQRELPIFIEAKKIIESI